MKQRKLGDATIARVLELNTPDFEPLGFFPETTEADWTPHLDWLKPRYMDPVSGNLYFPMQSYVIRTGHHNILVDGCVGNHKERPHRPRWHQKSDTAYLDGLAALGLRPEDIDYVMCTHMHVDHVGWNTQLIDGRWVPTFPNAKYLFSKKEYEYWLAESKKETLHHFEDSVLPIVQANRAQMITSDHALDDEIWLEPTPGHTPDHYAVRLQSAGSKAVFSGDLMHSPIQCRHPEWRARPDYDPQQARETRKAFMEKYVETDVLIVTAHFPLPSAGRFVRHGDAFMFEYEEVGW